MKYRLQASVRWQRTTFRMMVLALLLMIASALVMAQKTKAAIVRIQNGAWVGTTSKGNRILFKVKNYQVVGYILPFEYSCEESGWEGSGSLETPDAAKRDIEVSRTTGAFRIHNLKVEVPGAPEIRQTFTVQGRFRSDGSASGTLQIAIPRFCAHPVKVTWKATLAAASEPQNNKQPPATPLQAGKIEEKSSEQKVDPDKRYEQCVRAVVDRLLASKTHQVKGYAFGRLSTGGFGGYVSTTGGSTLYVDESTKQGAVSAFVSTLAMAIPGFAMQRFELQGELGACEYESK